MVPFGKSLHEQHPQDEDEISRHTEGSPNYKKCKNGGISKNIIRFPWYSLDLFFYVPIVMIKRGNTPISTINLNPSLKLFVKPPKWESYSPDRTFKITQRDLPLVVRFLKEVVFWFDDPSKQNLFVIDNNNELVFNYDYSELKSVMKLEAYGSTQTLKAIPDIISRNDKDRTEGIRLMVNKTENVLSLTYGELYTLYSVLDKFDFTTESTMAYLLVSSLIKKGRYEYAVNKYE